MADKFFGLLYNVSDWTDALSKTGGSGFMDNLDRNRKIEPWPKVEEDPLTGFPNFLALLSDLEHVTSVSRGIALCLYLADVSPRLADESQESTTCGAKSREQAITRLSKSILRALSKAGFANAKYYRLAENEFCVCLSGSSQTDAKTFIDYLEADDSCPAFAYVTAEREENPANPVEMLLDLWMRLHPQNSLGGEQDSLGVARQLMTKINETVDLLRRAVRLAYTDDTTGLPNHRAATYTIRAYLEAEDSPRPLSLLFVDGDNLRQYNDELGYKAGNEMIRRLGASISGAAAPEDTVTRWLSGDEFMIILPGTDRKRAVEKANSICAAVKKKSARWPFPVTVSIGVVTCPEDGFDIELLLAKVEKANNSAKKMGKNQVCDASGH